MAEQEEGWTFNKVIGFAFGGGVLDKVLKSKRLPLIILALVLVVLYIMNGYHAYYVSKQNEKLDKEIRELRAEYISTQTELISKKKYGKIQDKINESGLGLEESKTPPYSISMKASGKK